MKAAVLIAAVTAAVCVYAADPPDQAKRGMELFRTSAKGACSTCHRVEGFGNPAGPDLSKTAAALPPRAMAMAIRATMTVYVQEVKPKEGTPFPGMKSEDGSGFWDLSATPPVLKKFAKGEAETAQNTKWKHPPESAGYTNEQLADVIAYLRFVASGDRKGVDAEILQ